MKDEPESKPCTVQGLSSAPKAASLILSAEEMSLTMSKIVACKADAAAWRLLLLGLLAGLYIGFGSHLFLVAMQAGMGRIVGGAVFGLGLVLVVVAGAELFTGNAVMATGILERDCSLSKMLRNWIWVYLGNMAGSLLLVFLVLKSGLLSCDGAPTALGGFAAGVAAAKLELTFEEAFCRGILCNILVVSAVNMAILARDIVSKIFCCILPIMAFVASGYEHCVANMYLIPAGLAAKGVPLADHLAIFRNLLPVTLGNILGGIGIIILYPNRFRQLLALLQRRPAARQP